MTALPSIVLEVLAPAWREGRRQAMQGNRLYTLRTRRRSEY
jgi:hypothetical protein